MANQDIQAQKNLLQQVQSANANRLVTSGILRHLLKANGVATNPLATPIVFENPAYDADGRNVSHTKILYLEESGDTAEWNVLQAARRIGEKTIAAPGLSQSEARVVTDMASGLREMRETGLLPDLSDALHTIKRT